MDVLFLLVALLNLAIGFMLGKYYERLRWNDLIRRRVLTRPCYERGKERWNDSQN